MTKLLLNLYYWPIFGALTIFGIFILPVILLYQCLFLSRSCQSALRRSIRLYGWLLVSVIPFFGFVRVEYSNDNLPLPAIFVANHNSAIDPYLFGALNVENCFVTSWPFKIPVYNIFMRMAGYVNSEDGWDNMLKKCRALFESGSSVTIWPEGHRSRSGMVERFKKGAFTLAVETGVPLIPVCIVGSGKVLPPGKKLLNPGCVRLIVLDPVYPDVQAKNGNEHANYLRKTIHELLEKNLRENGHFSKCSAV